MIMYTDQQKRIIYIQYSRIFHEMKSPSFYNNNLLLQSKTTTIKQLKVNLFWIDILYEIPNQSISKVCLLFIYFRYMFADQHSSGAIIPIINKRALDCVTNKSYIIDFCQHLTLSGSSKGKEINIMCTRLSLYLIR